MNLKQYLKNHNTSSKISSIAFIDLLFLLLIFIILFTNFTLDKGYKVNLPSSKLAQKFPSSKMLITITPSITPKKYNYYFNKKKISFNKIEIILSKEIKKKEKAFKNNGFFYARRLSLKADETIPYSIISYIFNLAQKYQLNLIVLAK